MKTTITIDCTPAEARAFFGLPDTGPLQAAWVDAVGARLRDGSLMPDADALLKAWAPAGAEAMDSWRRLWSPGPGTGRTPD